MPLTPTRPNPPQPCVPHSLLEFPEHVAMPHPYPSRIRRAEFPPSSHGIFIIFSLSEPGQANEVLIRSDMRIYIYSQSVCQPSVANYFVIGRCKTSLQRTQFRGSKSTRDLRCQTSNNISCQSQFWGQFSHFRELSDSSRVTVPRWRQCVATGPLYHPAFLR